MRPASRGESVRPACTGGGGVPALHLFMHAPDAIPQDHAHALTARRRASRLPADMTFNAGWAGTWDDAPGQGAVKRVAPHTRGAQPNEACSVGLRCALCI